MQEETNGAETGLQAGTGRKLHLLDYALLRFQRGYSQLYLRLGCWPYRTGNTFSVAS